jgi:hypothetical protein
MEELQNPISRRRMLKRVGAGAAIAWSAPILSSLRTPAFAQAYPDRCPTCEACGAQTVCGEGCTCIPAAGGGCFCHDIVFCNNPGITTCTTDADCEPSQAQGRGPGWRCASSCCGTNLCHPPCGAGLDPAVAGGAAAGRTSAG